jgi:mRNA interferase MazF
MGMKRFDVFLINLDPIIGTEIKKTRPCVIISPNEMNDYIQTVIIAPMTTKNRDYPTRIDCFFDNKQAQIVLDQIRAVDKSRLIKNLGRISDIEQENILETLAIMFSK